MTTLYAATAKGIIQSTDGGDTWTATGFAVNSAITNDIVVDPDDSSTLYIGVSASRDAFVAKLNPTGSQLVYSTYLGGIDEDRASAIALDSMGNATITGVSLSRSIPTTADGNPPPSGNSPLDVFVTKLNANATALIYSTYIGGSSDDVVVGVAVDAADRIYVAGWTNSTNFPTTPGAFQAANPGGFNGFVVKLSFLKLTGASVSGKKLIVTGAGFDKGAVIVIDGKDQKTRNDETSPASMLVGKKAGKTIAPGQSVTIEVRNSDGTISNRFNFVRPVQ